MGRLPNIMCGRCESSKMSISAGWSAAERSLANGTIATVSHSYFAPRLKQHVRVIGHEDWFEWKDGTLFDFEGNVITPEYSISELAEQEAEFVSAVRENRPPSITPETILPTMRVLADAQASFDAERAVRR